MPLPVPEPRALAAARPNPGSPWRVAGVSPAQMEGAKVFCGREVCSLVAGGPVASGG